MPAPINERSIPLAEVRKIQEFACDVAASWETYASHASPQLVRDVNAIANELSGTQEALRAPDTLAGIAIINNMPFGLTTLEPTPFQQDRVSELARNPAVLAGSLRADIGMLVVGRCAGEPFGWVGEQDKEPVTRIVNNVMPIQGKEVAQVGASSRELLTPHTEDPFSPDRANLLLIGCLRNPDRVATTFASIKEVELSDDQRTELGKTVVSILQDEVYDRDDSAPPVKIPIVGYVDGEPRLRYDDYFSLFDGVGDTFMSAYSHLKSEFDRVHQEVKLTPHQAILIDNDIVVHGRVPFTARYDGSDRWLKRVNVRLANRRRAAAEMREVNRGQLPVRPFL